MASVNSGGSFICLTITKSVSKFEKLRSQLWEKMGGNTMIPFLSKFKGGLEEGEIGKDGNDGDRSSIASLFVPLVVASKVLGTGPLTVSRKGETGNPGRIKFRVNLWDWKTIGSLCIGSMFLFMWFAYIYVFTFRKALFGIEFTKNNTCILKLDDHLRRYKAGEVGLISIETAFWLSHLIMPASQILDIILAWINSWAFARFVNGFRKIENALLELDEGWTSTLRKALAYRNCLLAVYVVVPTLLAAVGSAWALAERNKMPVLAKIFFCIFGIQVIAVPLLQDAKTLISYMVITKLQGQVRTGLQNIITQTYEKTRGRMVKEYRKILLQIREQCEACCRWQQNRELMIVCNTVIILTLVLYLAAHSTGIDNLEGRVRVKLMCAAFGAVLISRIYFKVLLAEKIESEEQAIAKQLMIAMTNIEADDEFVYEAKITHDLLAITPTRITLGNFVTFNKGLLLKIFYLVVTYLIVLAQFSVDYTKFNPLQGVVAG